MQLEPGTAAHTRVSRGCVQSLAVPVEGLSQGWLVGAVLGPTWRGVLCTHRKVSICVALNGIPYTWCPGTGHSWTSVNSSPADK